MGISRADLRMHIGRRGRRMRAALKSGGLEERYCIKEGLAGTLLTTAFKGVFYLLQRKSRLS